MITDKIGRDVFFVDLRMSAICSVLCIYLQIIPLSL
jgi:hypothetical protein